MIFKQFPVRLTVPELKESWGGNITLIPNEDKLPQAWGTDVAGYFDKFLSANSDFFTTLGCGIVVSDVLYNSSEWASDLDTALFVVETKDSSSLLESFKATIPYFINEQELPVGSVSVAVEIVTL